jgi:signal transduction histidine kinase
VTRPKLIMLVAPLVLGLAIAGAAGVWLVARTRGRLDEDMALVVDVLVADLRRGAEDAISARAAAEAAEIDEMTRTLESLGRALGSRLPTSDELAELQERHGIDGILVVESGEIVLTAGWGGPDGRSGGRGLLRRLDPLIEGRIERFVERDHRTRFGDRRATIVAVRSTRGGAMVARRTRPLRDPGGTLSLEGTLDRLAADEHVAWAEVRSGSEVLHRGSDGAAVVMASRALPAAIAGPNVTVRLGLAPGPMERRLAEERRSAAVFGVALLTATALIGLLLFALAVRSERRLATLGSEMERAARLAALGHLGAGLAHEIRNPLNALRLALTRVRTKSPGGDLDRYTRVAEEEIERLDEVVRRTLAWAREEDAGPMEPVELVPAVHAAVRAEGNTDAEIDAEPTSALASPDALDHVIRNLVRNAREAGGRVHIEVRPGPPPVVVVEDDGPGWPDEFRERLTDPFVTTREDGAGIGLYLAQRLTSRMNGVLRLEDRPGGGARVVVELAPLEEEVS